MAGRTAIVALWSFQPGGPVVDRMWIDAKSGIILRWINYSKPGDAFIRIEDLQDKMLAVGRARAAGGTAGIGRRPFVGRGRRGGTGATAVPVGALAVVLRFADDTVRA